jgi:hypothetical protein
MARGRFIINREIRIGRWTKAVQGTFTSCVWAGILFDSTNRRSLIQERFVDQEQVASIGLSEKIGLNQRTSRRIIRQGWVDYEQVATAGFARKTCFDKRTRGR